MVKRPVAVIDRSLSQQAGTRMASTDAAEKALKEAAARLGNTELRTVEVRSGITADDDGTRAFEALNRALAEIPPERFAGAIMVTDGLTQAHNRRYLTEQLQKEIQRSRRHGRAHRGELRCGRAARLRRARVARVPARRRCQQFHGHGYILASHGARAGTDTRAGADRVRGPATSHSAGNR